MNGQSTPFGATSRYYGLATETFVDASGESHAYVPRRFIPPSDAYAVIGTYQVTTGDRYDTISATYLGDPEQFWRLCDANAVMDPDDIETVGAAVNITLPAGVPGYPGD